MDLIMVFSTRHSGSGEPTCPTGTFAAGCTMDSWQKWCAMCLAALSVEDIKDVYLFGTMIAGLLLIGLGNGLVYRQIEDSMAAARSPTKLCDMIEVMSRAVGTQTVVMNRNMDNMHRNMVNIMEKLMEKLTALQGKMDRFEDHNRQRE